MKRLLKIEFQKLLYSRKFWIILGLYVLLLAPIAFGFENFLKSVSINNGDPNQPNMAGMLLRGYSVFNYPDVWHNMAYLGSWFNLLLAVIIITFVTDEFQYKTLRQNIIDGMSKWEIVLAKELVILVLSLFSVVFVSMLVIILGKSRNDAGLFSGASIMLPYFASVILYLNFAYLVSSWLKKSGFVLGILLLYTLVIENLISTQVPETVANFFPMNLVSNMIPNPFAKILGADVTSDFSVLNIIVCVIYIGGFIFLNYWLLKKGNAGRT